ncbi:MAG: cytochrome c biogenesis protein CcsA [Thiotrichaceae bacterium]|nr:cytochrome c biogenesis protein CcsA [Thiotrichaceae bacterium]
MNWFKYAAPANFYPIAGALAPWFIALAGVLAIIGLYWGFFQTPDILTDQKQYYRIIFVHVASAWMGMWLYAMLVLWALIGIIFNTRLSYMFAAAIAPTGAMFTFLSLWTGAFWGEPSWGTWWDWDPRMTSMLILLFLYIGYMALQSAIDDPRRSDKASSVLAMVGLVMVPVIYWSVNCPNPAECAALHQSSSMEQIDPNIRNAMFIMVASFWIYSFGVIMLRIRNIILEREKQTRWVQELKECQ